MIDHFRESVHYAAEQIDSGTFSTDDATVNIYLAAILQWRKTARASGQRAAHLDALVANLRGAQNDGLGSQGFYSEALTMEGKPPTTPADRTT